jgi:hypothetical protein
MVACCGMRLSATQMCCTLASVLLATAANAALDFGVSAGLGASDNVTLAPDDEVDETMVALGAGLALDYQGRRLQSFIVGSLAYIEYLDDTFDSELVGNVAADVNLALIPEYLNWRLQDNFGQVRRNPTAPTTPSNRENTNYLTTGPELTLPLGERTALRIGGLYSDAYYEESDAGSEALSGSAALIRTLTRATRISLNGSVTSTEYDALPNIDFDDYEAFVNYTIEAARTTLSFDAGYTELRFDDVSSDGYLARLAITRQLGRSSTFSLTAGREFSNSADELRRLQVGDTATDTTTQPLQAVAGPFESTYAGLDWDFALNRTQLGAGVGYFEEDYELSDLFNRDRVAYYARAGRDLNRAFSVRAEVEYSTETYNDIDREFAAPPVPGEFSELTANASIDWRLGRHVYATLMYRWTDRSDDVAANEFQENQVWLLLGYSRNGTGSQLGRPNLPVMREGTGTR